MALLKKKLARRELCNLIEKAKSDSESFIRKQGERLEKYLKKLVEGKISKAEFENLVKELVSLKKMRSLKISVETKVKAGKLPKALETLY